MDISTLLGLIQQDIDDDRAFARDLVSQNKQQLAQLEHSRQLRMQSLPKKLAFPKAPTVLYWGESPALWENNIELMLPDGVQTRHSSLNVQPLGYATYPDGQMQLIDTNDRIQIEDIGWDMQKYFDVAIVNRSSWRSYDIIVDRSI